jgi:quercetin dioxygenase-like cupin family protein/DNA-binding XRE family transcriptional regulator
MSLPTTPDAAAIFSKHRSDATPDPLAGLGERMARARHDRGLTLAAVAARSGMSPAYVSQVENGSANPTLRALRRIAEAIDTDVGQLVGAMIGTGDPWPGPGFEPGHSPAALAHAVAGAPGIWEHTAPGSTRLVARLVHGAAADHEQSVVHPGEEYVLVLNGVCRLHVGGARFDLGPGDACHFDAERPHHLSAVSADLTLSVVMSARG